MGCAANVELDDPTPAGRCSLPPLVTRVNCAVGLAISESQRAMVAGAVRSCTRVQDLRPKPDDGGVALAGPSSGMAAYPPRRWLLGHTRRNTSTSRCHPTPDTGRHHNARSLSGAIPYSRVLLRWQRPVLAPVEACSGPSGAPLAQPRRQREHAHGLGQVANGLHLRLGGARWRRE